MGAGRTHGGVTNGPEDDAATRVAVVGRRVAVVAEGVDSLEVDVPVRVAGVRRVEVGAVHEESGILVGVEPGLADGHVPEPRSVVLAADRDARPEAGDVDTGEFDGAQLSAARTIVVEVDSAFVLQGAAPTGHGEVSDLHTCRVVHGDAGTVGGFDGGPPFPVRADPDR